MKWQKFLIGVLFCISFCLICPKYHVLANSKVEVLTKQLQVGEAIQVASQEDVSFYKWFVNGTEVSEGNEYTPLESEYEKWISVIGYDSAGNEVGADKVYFSKLPVVYIDTDDGSAIANKNEKSASLFIQGNDTFSAQYEGKITVKLRGNSSAGFPQKPYKIKLDKSTDLFGMGKSKHWVLISSYIDQCAMRNKLGSDFAKHLGLENMDMTWVDVVVNGEYAGLYMLSEHIRIGSTRVNIFNWDDEAETIAKKVAKKDKLSDEDKKAIEDLLSNDYAWVSTGEFVYKGKSYVISDYYDNGIYDISGGYLYELSAEYDEVSKFTTDNGLLVMLNKPENLYTNDDMMGYSATYWQNLENSLISDSGYDSNGMHYSDYADKNSMQTYWLTMEILGNNDSAYKSRYAYIGADGKLHFGPVWDFDWGCGSYTVGTNPANWKLSNGTLWRDFVDDPYFQVKAAEIYDSVTVYC